MPAPNPPIEFSVLFFLQLTIVLSACRILGLLAKRFGQPTVVGEMIAGILLGPSLFGLVFPQWYQTVFPSASLPILYALSQLGLTLYMFVIGMEFNLQQFHNHSKPAVVISVVGMLTPFIAGSFVALWLYHQQDFFGDKVSLLEAVLFLGASLSVTAFPMLARIIDENNLVETPLGTLSLAAGAIDDVVAWSILAVILSFSSHEWTAPLLAIGGGIAYTFFVVAILRPWLHSVSSKIRSRDLLTKGYFLLILIIVMFGACATNAIGVHAVFGAFVIGCAIPRGLIAETLRERIEPVTTTLLVPLFFVYSGLKTRLDLVSTPGLIGVTILVILVASISKGLACWWAARWAGENQGTAMGVGCLMNARGMMGLILLTIGKDHGIIGTELFSILVLMTLVTTLVATPSYHWVQSRYSMVTVNGNEAI